MSKTLKGYIEEQASWIKFDHSIGKLSPETAHEILAELQANCPDCITGGKDESYFIELILTIVNG